MDRLAVILSLGLLLAVDTAAGATYFVGPNGNDSNLGTSRESAWRNPQRCANPTPLVAGDTCLVLPGTYTNATGTGTVLYVRSTSPQGSPSKPITFKSETPLGAVIVVPRDNGVGIRVAAPYYVFDGFDIRGVENNTNSFHYGFKMSASANGLVIRNNSIHDIGKNVCATVANHVTAAGIEGTTSNVLIENNRFYTIGQLRPGENGCNGDYDNQDHGIYYSSGSGLTVRNNVFYDVNRGYALQIYRGGGATTTNVKIINNVFADASPTALPLAQLSFSYTLKNIEVKNNIFYNPKQFAISWYHIETVENFVVSNNLTNGSEFLRPLGKPSTGLTEKDNIANTDPQLNNPIQRDYRLKATSPAIDRGVNVGLPFMGKAPDIGAFEFQPTQATQPWPPNSFAVQ